MLLVRGTAAAEATRKGAAAIASSTLDAGGRNYRGRAKRPDRPRPPLAKKGGTTPRLHTAAAAPVASAIPGGGAAAAAGGVFNRLKVAGDAPAPRGGMNTVPPSAVGLVARNKSTAAVLMDEDETDLPVGSAENGDVRNLTSFRLTDIGEGIMEVEVLQWFVGPGDRVSQFDKICEVQSDKANVEITSRYDGVVRKIHWDVGDMVQTGSVLVEIEEAAAGAAPDGAAGGSVPAQPFSSSAADGEPAPESSPAPRSPCPAEAAAAVLSVPSPAGVEGQWLGGGELNGGTGGTGGVGSGAGGSARRQVLATPAVRRLCRELSIHLSREPISGTGPGGRVLKGDVLAYAEKRTATSREAADTDAAASAGNSDARAGVGVEASRPPQMAGLGGLAVYGGAQAEAPPAAFHDDDDGLGSLSEVPGGRSSGPHRLEEREAARSVGESAPVEEGRKRLPTGERQPRIPAGVPERKEPVSVPIRGVQRAMMEAMQRALEVPHMTFCDEVDSDRLGQLRSDLTEAAERRGARLSYLPLIVKATSMALSAFPTLNASLSENRKSLLQHPSHNIGVAMDTSKGLLVPCISSVEEMSVLDIAEELNTLQRLGAAGKLGEAELSGTTFTLSNIGSIGGTYASPVILHPQVCIGALGRMQRIPRFDPSDPDKIVAARVFPVSWSADHRVVDGGTLARFSNTWKAYLENPALMLADTR